MAGSVDNLGLLATVEPVTLASSPGQELNKRSLVYRKEQRIHGILPMTSFAISGSSVKLTAFSPLCAAMFTSAPLCSRKVAISL